MNKPLAIIPCAGFGTRVSAKPCQSKELFISPKTNKPLIEYSLSICKKYNIEPLILLRKEKKDLIAYCKKNNIQYIIVPPVGEWIDTILCSEKFWRKENILFLPDTRWKPIDVVPSLLSGLKRSNIMLGIHYIEKEGHKWGMLFENIIYEKSDKILCGWAWGIIAWKNKEALKLFIELRDKKEHIMKSYDVVKLTSFKDVTRTGKVL